MRDTVSPLHGVNLSIAVCLKQCAAGTFRAVCPQADVRRRSLPLQIEATAARRLAFISGQRD